jgi:hypothetical protein
VLKVVGPPLKYVGPLSKQFLQFLLELMEFAGPSLEAVGKHAKVHQTIAEIRQATTRSYQTPIKVCWTAVETIPTLFLP